MTYHTFHCIVRDHAQKLANFAMSKRSHGKSAPVHRIFIFLRIIFEISLLALREEVFLLDTSCDDKSHDKRKHVNERDSTSDNIPKRKTHKGWNASLVHANIIAMLQ